MMTSVDYESSRLAETFESIFSASPWPLLIFDDAGMVLGASDEGPSRWLLSAGPVDGPLRQRAALYLAALGGDLSLACDQEADSARTGPGGAEINERLYVRRTSWGYCMTIVDRTEVRQLQTMDVQSARLATLGFMVAGVCHEMTNPLTSLHSIVQILNSEEHIDEELLGKGLANIAINVRRLLDISRRLVKFSRVGDEPRVRFAVDDVIEDALSVLHLEGSLRDIELHHSAAGDATVHGNVGQIHEIFVNLFINAVQAMGASGSLRIKTCCIGPTVEVLVSDSGPGVDPAAIERIFEPFFTTKAGAHGTGLGLAISSEFAREHGGAIELRRTSSSGAMFCVTLPKETP